MMLTGNADQETASEAVNAGQIFRFLTKPCSTAVLATSLALAVRQHNLLTAEKELLNKTVKGSISVMAELLSLTNAAAFSSGYRIKPMVKHISEELELANPWQYEVAALMSQIGCITLPGDVLHKLHAGTEALTDEEQQMYEKHAEVGSRLIRKIPRLEKVAGMIENQLRPFVSAVAEDSSDEEVDFGAEIIHAAIDYDLLRQQAVEHQLAIKTLRKKEGIYNPKILDILEKYRPKNTHTIIKNISLKEIIPGMIAEENVCAKNGALLLPKGQGVTWHVIQSLINFKKQIGIVEPIVVRVAEQEEQI
jgi:response regulator RpfG family c-di-GMP phosphodiesterase